MKKLDRIDPKILATNPRASLAAWLKYEPVVTAAFNQHPRPYAYKPLNMSPSSVCSKMRDAVRGRLAFSYPSTVSDHDLARWYEEVVFKHDKECVYIGPPEEVKTQLIGTVPESPTSLVFPTLSFEELAAFTLLLSNGRIVGPVRVKQPPDTTLLPKRPNVELMTRDDGSLVLL